jgi:SAM-dependent methyltransferase
MTAQDPGLSDDDRIGRRDSFSAEAERYDRVRPGYPAALFDRVAAFGALHPGARVLELGAGTGKATRSLVDRGWSVDAIELGEGMAAVLRDRLGDRVRVVVGAFEEVPIAPAHYDLVLCATAFHWLDPTTRVERVARALRPGGTAAIVWTRHVQGGTRAFADVESHTVPLEVAYGTDDYLDLIATYSETVVATPEQRATLLAGLRTLIDRDFSGRVVKRYVFELVLARRAA